MDETSWLLDFQLDFSVAVIGRCSVKKMFLKISQNSRENTCARVSFSKKETLTQAFSYEFCEIFKNTFFIEHFWWLLLAITEKLVFFKHLGINVVCNPFLFPNFHSPPNLCIPPFFPDILPPLTHIICKGNDWEKSFALLIYSECLEWIFSNC